MKKTNSFARFKKDVDIITMSIFHPRYFFFEGYIETESHEDIWKFQESLFADEKTVDETIYRLLSKKNFENSLKKVCI
jgi:hypothetical protein